MHGRSNEILGLCYSEINYLDGTDGIKAEELDMRSLKATVLSAALVSAGAIAAHAAYQTPVNQGYPPQVNQGYPPQVAANPGAAYPNAPQPAPMVAPSPSTQPPQGSAEEFSMPGSQSGKGSFYSKKGFGPAPN
jgi:hypothetical protein